MKRSKIEFETEKELKVWLTENEGVKLFTSTYRSAYCIYKGSDKYFYRCDIRNTYEDMVGIWHWRVFHLEVQQTTVELPYDKYYKLFKECTSTDQASELNRAFGWDGVTFFDKLKLLKGLPTWSLFPINSSIIHEIEEFEVKTRKTGLVGVKQVECVLPEEGTPEDGQSILYLDNEESSFIYNTSFNVEHEVDQLIIRAGWFKRGDEEHATKYFKALLNIED